MSQSARDDETHESNQSLWLLTVSPTIWAVHFLLSYITAAIWCAKAPTPDSLLTPVRVAMGLYTLLALVGIGITGWIGRQRHDYGAADPPHDADTPEDRYRFLGFATLLLSALSAVGVIYAALPAVFLGNCR